MDQHKNGNLNFLDKNQSKSNMKSEHSKRKPFILITNDDSVDSPLLAILIEALKFKNDFEWDPQFSEIEETIFHAYQWAKKLN